MQAKRASHSALAPHALPWEQHVDCAHALQASLDPNPPQAGGVTGGYNGPASIVGKGIGVTLASGDGGEGGDDGAGGTPSSALSPASRSLVVVVDPAELHPAAPSVHVMQIHAHPE
jgi:hypothetical protein